MLQTWRNERLTYHWDFHHFDDIEVLPKPLQQPHPPVWLAATSPGAISRCAQNGFTIMMDPHGTHRDIEIKRAQETLPLEYLMCAALSHSSFELFTEKVLPHFL